MGSTARPGGLGLPRFLAMILFGFAAVIGLPCTLIAGSFLLRGDPGPLGVAAGGLLVAWAVGWLGTVLWSGRMIPRWFVGGFLIGIMALVPCGAFFGRCTWMEYLGLLAPLIPMAWQVGSILRNYPTTPVKPAPLGDFD